jgi:hypothetical protein
LSSYLDKKGVKIKKVTATTREIFKYLIAYTHIIIGRGAFDKALHDNVIRQPIHFVKLETT